MSWVGRLWVIASYRFMCHLFHGVLVDVKEDWVVCKGDVGGNGNGNRMVILLKVQFGCIARVNGVSFFRS